MRLRDWLKLSDWVLVVLPSLVSAKLAVKPGEQPWHRKLMLLCALRGSHSNAALSSCAATQMSLSETRARGGVVSLTDR